jgi:hypothetical protein
MNVLTKFKSAIVEFDTTQSLIGAYAGLKASRISRGLTEEVAFDAAETKVIEETIAAMRELQSSVQPQGVPVNWSLVGRVKPLVDQRRAALRESADPVVRMCWLIRISLTGYFLRVRDGNVITTPSETLGAAFEGTDTADQVVRELAKLGTKAQKESFSAFRRRSTMSHTLFDVGFETAAIGGSNETAKTAA